MLTIAPRTHFACRYRHVCVYCLLDCLVCACDDVVPAAGASGRARTHALHVHIIMAYTFYSLAWSLRAAGLALINLSGWMHVW